MSHPKKRVALLIGLVLVVCLVVYAGVIAVAGGPVPGPSHESEECGPVESEKTPLEPTKKGGCTCECTPPPVPICYCWCW